MTARFYDAITIWQPWATLIAEEIKVFEFRKWQMPHDLVGRPIAIHASARPARKTEIRELTLNLQGPNWRQTGIISRRDDAIALLDPGLVSPGRYPLSVILCLATFDEPIRNHQLAEIVGMPASNDSNWGWPITNVRKLDPVVQAKGERGFWRVELEVPS